MLRLFARSGRLSLYHTPCDGGSPHAAALAIFLFGMMAVVVQEAHAMQNPPEAEKLVRLRAIADATAITPGEKFHLAVVFEIEPHWHIYWVSSGASGAPTELRVTAPEGFAAGAVQFPRPERFEEEMIGTTYGYSRETVLFVPMTAPDVIAADEAAFTIDVQFLVCKGVCLFGSKKLAISLPVRKAGEVSSVENAAGAEVIKKYRDQLPKPLNKLKGAHASLEGRSLVITGPAGSSEGVTLFPIEHPGVTINAARSIIAGGAFRITADITIEPQNALGKPMAIEGVIGLGEKRSDPAYHFIIPLDERGRMKPSPTPVTPDPEERNSP